MASLKTALYRYIGSNLEDNSINYDGYEAVVQGKWKQLECLIISYFDKTQPIGVLAVVGGNWKCHKNIGISVTNAKLGGDLKNILNNRYPKI